MSERITENVTSGSSSMKSQILFHILTLAFHFPIQYSAAFLWSAVKEGSAATLAGWYSEGGSHF